MVYEYPGILTSGIIKGSIFIARNLPAGLQPEEKSEGKQNNTVDCLVRKIFR